MIYRASTSHGQFFITGPFHQRMREFLTALGGKWSNKHRCWLTRAMPSIAWRLYHEAPVKVEGDDAYQQLVIRFDDGLKVRPIGVPGEAMPAWAHQVAARNFVGTKQGALLAMDMGTGKTKVAIDLMLASSARKVLMLCPTSVVGVWDREIQRHGSKFADWTVAKLGQGLSVKDKLAYAMRQQMAWKNNPQGPFAVIVNYESAWREPLEQWLVEYDWDWIIADESHRLKSATSKVSKFAAKLGMKPCRRLALTGTPLPHSPLDAFSQFRFIDTGIFGDSYHRFRSQYAVMNQKFPSKVDKWINQGDLSERMAILTYQVKASEVLDLPEAIHQEIPIELGADTARAYKSMQRHMIVQVDAGAITAANALVGLLKLQQITSGYGVTEDGAEVHLGDDKLNALLDLADGLPADEKLVVFCRFKHDLRAVAKVAESLGRRYHEISGATKDALTEHSTLRSDAQIVGVQIQAGGVGIDLTAARYAVYYSIGYNLAEYDQSLARLRRPGQTRTVYYYHLVAPGTVDQVVYKALGARRDLVEAVLEAMKGRLLA